MFPSRRRLFLAGAAATALAIPCVLFGFLVSRTPHLWQPNFDYPQVPTHFYTAREAFDTALPQITSWHEDAIVTGMHHGPSGSPETWGIRADGKAAAWSFEVSSSSAMEYTILTLIDDVAFVSGRDGQPALPLRSSPTPLPSDWTVDSDQALTIATSAGAQGLPTMISTTHWRYTSDALSTPESFPLAWQLSFGQQGRQPYVLVDMYSGTILQNDFMP